MGSNGLHEINKKIQDGKVYPTKNYGDLIIVDYRKWNDVLVKFLNTGNHTIARISDIKSGGVKDRFAPTVCGVGFVGDAPVKLNGKIRKEYTVWRNMLQRCYDDDHQVKSPTYAGCTVSDNFKDYTYFQNWYISQIGADNDWFLDKDILVRDNKVYSEGTCVLVPREINNLLTKRQNHRGVYPIGVTVDKRGGNFFAQLNVGKDRRKFGYSSTPEGAFLAYKEAKEAYIKEVANRWKDQIDPRAYDALLRYEVEITD